MQNTRLLLLIILISAIGCGRVDNNVPADTAVLGTWKLMGMTKEPFPIDQVNETDMIGGVMTFKEDKTFDGEIVYPKTPEKNMKVSGTYSVENETLTISNKTNNSTTRSTLKFEKDFMIATPVSPNGLIAYYKRVN